ncbi:hypothetical protein [Nocardia sp. XZ_19_231]|uniref:hypothetical protein n=1 Tax=Nocardia sp. XZ_19_231 TaxID=2769252 RepID=UPI0018909802|nr:hypothetical protein [Nocardia sp. XZ_19_231]
MPTPLVRKTAVAAALAVALLCLTACNDEVGTAKPASTPVATSAGTPAGAPAAGRAGQSTVRTVGKTGWYDNFAITVDKATVVPDEYGGAEVTIDITYANTGLADRMLGLTPTLLVNGELEGGATFDSPTVAAGGKGKGKAEVPVRSLDDAEHLIDTMTIVYGTATDNQTIIALKKDAKVQSVEPRSFPTSAKLTQGETTVTVTGATLHPSYSTGERGKSDVALHITLTGGSGIPAGGANIYYQYFSVRTPDGRTVPADFKGPINELLGARQTIDKPDNFVVFAVDSPGTGAYTLVYNALGAEGEASAPTAAFTLN